MLGFGPLERLVAGARGAKSLFWRTSPAAARSSQLLAVEHQCRTKVALTRRPSLDLILVIRPATAVFELIAGNEESSEHGFQVATGIKPSMGG